jgi:APA family basic amino acid/polyamine antiporter
MLLITDPAAFEGRRLARDAAIAVLAFAYAVWAIAGAGEEIIAKGFVLLLAGIPVYLWLKWREGRTAAPPALPTAPVHVLQEH